MVILPQDLQLGILAFVTEPRANAVCSLWAKLYGSLDLECRVSFRGHFHDKGKLTTSFNAIRALWHDALPLHSLWNESQCERVRFIFKFAPEGTFTLEWILELPWITKCAQA